MASHWVQLRRWIIPISLFFVIWAHGASIGLTDDEAYYWVLAQKPALGYAYHPPAVALSIAFAQALFGNILGTHSAALVRLPAAFCAAAIVALGAYWIRRAGGGRRAFGRGALVLISVAGIFSLSWMMVPDLPLFLGWTLAFVGTWEICFASDKELPRWSGAALAGGITLAILSKYSGVLAGASAFFAILAWAPRERRWRALGSLALGGTLALAPILWWNAQHGWGSILYQIRERHGDGQISWIRYGRFWAIEFVLAGPALLWFMLHGLKRGLKGQADGAEKFVALWVMPGALIFLSQPLWADFKPHWALIVWWPLALALGRAWSMEKAHSMARLHVLYGMVMAVLVLVACHFPIGNWALDRFGTKPLDPRLDVTNDLYGWSELRRFLDTQADPASRAWPIVGSRYQTASQAAFAMGGDARVTLLPRDLKSLDEWQNSEASDGQGPEWPRLNRPLWFVADNRYDAAPEFPGATCRKELTLNAKRGEYLAKSIYLWKCEPAPSRL